MGNPKNKATRATEMIPSKIRLVLVLLKIPGLEDWGIGRGAAPMLWSGAPVLRGIEVWGCTLGALSLPMNLLKEDFSTAIASKDKCLFRFSIVKCRALRNLCHLGFFLSGKIYGE